MLGALRGWTRALIGQRIEPKFFYRDQRLRQRPINLVDVLNDRQQANCRLQGSAYSPISVVASGGFVRGGPGRHASRCDDDHGDSDRHRSRSL